MHVGLSSLDLEIEIKAAAKRRRHENRGSVVRDSIDADDETGVAQLLNVLLHVEDQVFDLSFFATFNRDDAPRVTKTKLLACFDGKNGAKKRVAVVIGTATVHDSIFDDGVAGICVPALSKRLLVHVAIHKHSLVQHLKLLHLIICNYVVFGFEDDS